MADEKKFLDQAGVQYLWSQLSMEDYPNNETLIAVLNAIDQTKADKEEVDKQIAVMNDRVVATDDGELTNVLPDMFGGHAPDEYMLKAEMPEVEKSDWSVNDENDAAYIKNRTHWTDDDGTVHKIDEKYLPDVGVRSWNDLTDKPFGGTTTTRIVDNYTLDNPSVDMSVLSSTEGPNYYRLTISDGFSVGDTVVVTWNGQKYSCKAYALEGCAAVGNSMYMGGGDTGEPFLIGCMAPMLAVITFDTGAVVSIDIEETKKMSGKYVEGMGWSEKSTKEVLPETFVAEPAEQFDGFNIYPINCVIEGGKKYTIIYNGVAYDVISGDNGMIVFAGNFAFFDESVADTGEPFLISLDALTGEATVGTWDGGGITISISEVAETVHPIDKKYLPSSGSSNLRVFISMDENEEYVSSHTYEEIKSHVLNGGTCDCAFGINLFHLTKATFLNEVQTFDLVYEVVFANVESDMLTYVRIRENGRVNLTSYTLSLQEI